MLTQDIKKIKKHIIYRCFYSGTKETDLIYKKILLNKIDILNFSELKLLLNLFNNFSDNEIFKFLTKKKQSPIKYEKMFKKLIND